MMGEIGQRKTRKIMSKHVLNHYVVSIKLRRENYYDFHLLKLGKDVSDLSLV